MRSGILAAGAAAMLLSGCESLSGGLDLAQIENELNTNYTFEAIDRAAYRGFASSYSEMPFEFGAMSVVSAEHGEIHTYTLVRCGETVCAGSVNGPRGRVESTPDYVIVSGLHGRTFWLSPGGDGALVRSDGETVPLAWDSLTGPF